MGFNPRTSRIVNHNSTTELKNISTNAVDRGGYELLQFL